MRMGEVSKNIILGLWLISWHCIVLGVQWICWCVAVGVPRARIFKLLRSPRIDSKEPIPLGCVAWRAVTTRDTGYDNPISTRFLSPIDSLKIPALYSYTPNVVVSLVSLHKPTTPDMRNTNTTLPLLLYDNLCSTKNKKRKIILYKR